MRRRHLTVRFAGLLLTGELAVHELRYVIAPESSAEHGYLPLLGLLSVMVLAVAAGQLVAMLECARRTGRDERVGMCFRVAWPLLGLAVLAAFALQETTEALVAGAGAGAPVAAFAGGGWVALPLAASVSAVLALALSGAGSVVRAAARTARARARRRPPVLRSAAPVVCPPVVGVLARNLAGRAPPLFA